MAVPYKLTPQQEELVLQIWNSRPPELPPSIDELLIILFGKDLVEKEKIDSRSRFGRTLKEFLASKNISHKPPEPFRDFELTEENKEWIKNNKMLSVTELTRAITNNGKLTHLSTPGRVIEAYLEQLKQPAPVKEPDKALNGQYFPPATVGGLLRRINKYILNGINQEKITPQQRKNCHALLGYLHAYSFVSQINAYQTEEDKELFESTMIRTCYDKDDLTEEEVDQYCTYAANCVIYKQISNRIEQYQRIQDEDLAAGGRPNMTLVEAVDTLSRERNECFKRQDKLLSHLKGTRSERLAKARTENSSILNLVTMWKQEESRKKMIKLAEVRKQKLEKDIKELEGMPEFVANIMGISIEEALN